MSRLRSTANCWPRKRQTCRKGKVRSKHWRNSWRRRRKHLKLIRERTVRSQPMSSFWKRQVSICRKSRMSWQLPTALARSMRLMWSRKPPITLRAFTMNCLPWSDRKYPILTIRRGWQSLMCRTIRKRSIIS